MAHDAAFRAAERFGGLEDQKRHRANQARNCQQKTDQLSQRSAFGFFWGSLRVVVGDVWHF
jgi:hypothetical protein